MYYNTKRFGKEIRKIREQLKLTQNDIILMTGINSNTIRRLENGKVVPKQETLDLLSVVLKQDISQLFLNCRIEESSEYFKLLSDIENALELSNTDQLKNNLNKINSLSESHMNEYYKLQLEQLTCLINCAILLITRSDNDAAFNYAIQGLKLTIINFNLENYKDYLYTKIELQLLMCLALIKRNSLNIEIGSDLLTHCIQILNNQKYLRTGNVPTKIYINASYIHYIQKNYSVSLKYALEGIAYNNTSRSQYALGHLYARKGFAEFKLNYGYDTYMTSFKNAYFYHDVLQQTDLKEVLVTVLKTRMDIDLLNYI